MSDRRFALASRHSACDDALHGDVEYYYVVEHTTGGTTIAAYAVDWSDDGPQRGRVVQEAAVPQPFSSSFSSPQPVRR